MYALRHIEPLVTLIVLLLCFRERKGNILWYYLLLSFATDIATILLRYVYHYQHYQIIGSIFVLLEFLVFLYYYYLWQIINKWVLWFTAALGGVLYVFVSFTSFGAGADAVLHSFMFIPPLALSIYSYFKLMQNMEYERITRLSFFWANTGIFVLTSCAFLLRLSQFQIKKFPIETQRSIFLLFLLFVAIKTVLIGISFRKANSHAKRP